MLNMFNKNDKKLKKEEPKEEVQPGFIGMLKDKRKRSGVILSGYFLFFVFVFIFIGLSNNESGSNIEEENNTNNNEEETLVENNYHVNYGYITYDQYSPLLEENYNYSITYNINEEEFIYEGSRNEDSYSKLDDNFNVPIGVVSLLDIEILMDLIKGGTLAVKTQYTTGGIVQQYAIDSDDYATAYELEDYNDEDVNITIYSNGTYVDKIEIDLTEFVIDKDIEIEIFLSDLGTITSVNE